MLSMPYAAVNSFESIIADYAGAKYGVAVDSCCNALFLCSYYMKVKQVTLPKFTYPGVASAVIHAGGKLKFEDVEWQGQYQLNPYPIIDSALRFRRGMYIKGTLYCLSFHAKKHLNIGRGGMILCDSEAAYKWFRKARFDGRSEIPLADDKITMAGWNMYLTPEQASRGLMLFDTLKNKDLDDMEWRAQNYPDLSKIKAYK